MDGWINSYQHNTTVTDVQLSTKYRSNYYPVINKKITKCLCSLVLFIYLLFFIPFVFKIRSLCLSLDIIEKSESVRVNFCLSKIQLNKGFCVRSIVLWKNICSNSLHTFLVETNNFLKKATL
jgi:hypothetical protein